MIPARFLLHPGGDPRRTAQDRSQILRFGVAGAVNTGFGYAAFAAFLLAGAGPLASLIGATVAGVLFNFQTSRRFVFRAEAHRDAGRGVRFATVYAVVLALNWVALKGLLAAGVPGLTAQALLVVPMAAVSFLGQKLLVFRAAPETEAGERPGSAPRQVRSRRAC